MNNRSSYLNRSGNAFLSKRKRCPRGEGALPRRFGRSSPFVTQYSGETTNGGDRYHRQPTARRPMFTCAMNYGGRSHAPKRCRFIQPIHASIPTIYSSIRIPIPFGMERTHRFGGNDAPSWRCRGSTRVRIHLGDVTAQVKGLVRLWDRAAPSRIERKTGLGDDAKFSPSPVGRPLSRSSPTSAHPLDRLPSTALRGLAVRVSHGAPRRHARE